MGFKMKGPSIHHGTTRHRSALKEIGDKLDHMNAGKAKANSPMKKEELIKIEKKPIEPIEMPEPEEKITKAKEFKTKKQLKEEKKVTRREEKLEKFKEKITDRKGGPTDRDMKRLKKKEANLKKYKETGKTKLQRGLKKTGEKVKSWAKDKIGDIKKGIKDRREERKAERSLLSRKERRSRIADTIEYIFLDGKRPEEAAHRRATGYGKDDKENKLDEPDPEQLNNIDNPENNEEETYKTLKSVPGDPWSYKYDESTDTYQTSKDGGKSWITPKPDSKADKAIRKRYSK